MTERTGDVAGHDETVVFHRSLPMKRMGAGAVIRDLDGNVLIVKPTYKDGWELPGGVARCCRVGIVELWPMTSQGSDVERMASRAFGCSSSFDRRQSKALVRRNQMPNIRTWRKR